MNIKTIGQKIQESTSNAKETLSSKFNMNPSNIVYEDTYEIRVEALAAACAEMFIENCKLKGIYDGVSEEQIQKDLQAQIETYKIFVRKD